MTTDDTLSVSRSFPRSIDRLSQTEGTVRELVVMSSAAFILFATAEGQPARSYQRLQTISSSIDQSMGKVDSVLALVLVDRRAAIKLMSLARLTVWSRASFGCLFLSFYRPARVSFCFAGR